MWTALAESEFIRGRGMIKLDWELECNIDTEVDWACLGGSSFESEFGSAFTSHDLAVLCCGSFATVLFSSLSSSDDDPPSSFSGLFTRAGGGAAL